MNERPSKLLRQVQEHIEYIERATDEAILNELRDYEERELAAGGPRTERMRRINERIGR